jgi:hypothetical protein
MSPAMSILPRFQKQTQKPLPEHSDILLKALWPEVQIEKGADNGQYAEFCDEALHALLGLWQHEGHQSLHEPHVGIRLLRDTVLSPTTTYDELKKKVSDVYGIDHPASSHDVQKAVRLLVRCWTMTTVDVQARPNRSVISWTGTQTLASMMEAQLYPLERASEDCAPRELDTDLKATNLVKYQRIHIKWDFDLSRHLKLVKSDGKLTLYVFKHKAWLNNCRWHSTKYPVPNDVLEEVIRTLNILFPPGDPGTINLLAGRAQMLDIGNCRVKTTRDLSAFRYWRARMAELDDLLNGPQKGIRRVYRLDKNRQNLMDIILFWVTGVAVLMLTVISSVCGIMSLLVSQDAFELARAQACADEDVRGGLPQYCSNL